jgi:TrmH family RNA methyltransferase
MTNSTGSKNNGQKSPVKEGISQSHYKLIKALNTKKGRLKNALFMAEGNKIIFELLNKNIKIKTIFSLEAWIDKVLELSNNETEVILITQRELKKISLLKNPSNIIALADTNSLPSATFDSKQPSLILDNIQDPGNMGTILRTACWFGIKQIVCSNNCADVLNPKVIQSSMGAFSFTQVFYVNLEEFIPKQKVPIYGALLDGKNISDTSWEPNSCIIIGNEGKGIDKKLIRYIQNPISIPKYGPMESLNAAMATAIICDRFRMACPHLSHPF